jgi:hypothetical protein
MNTRSMDFTKTDLLAPRSMMGLGADPAHPEGPGKPLD